MITFIFGLVAFGALAWWHFHSEKTHRDELSLTQAQKQERWNKEHAKLARRKERLDSIFKVIFVLMVIGAFVGLIWVIKFLWVKLPV